MTIFVQVKETLQAFYAKSRDGFVRYNVRLKKGIIKNTNHCIVEI